MKEGAFQLGVNKHRKSFAQLPQSHHCHAVRHMLFKHLAPNCHPHPHCHPHPQVVMP